MYNMHSLILSLSLSTIIRSKDAHYYRYTKVSMGASSKVCTCIRVYTCTLTDVLIRCWAQQPVERLSFVEIVRKLKGVPYKFKNEPLLTR